MNSRAAYFSVVPSPRVLFRLNKCGQGQAMSKHGQAMSKHGQAMPRHNNRAEAALEANIIDHEYSKAALARQAAKQ